MKLILSIFVNEKAETVELMLSQQIHRSYIGVIDAVVGQTLAGTTGENFKKKFVKAPKGNLTKVTELELPESAIWRKPVVSPPAHKKTTTTLGQVARVVAAAK